MNYTKMRRYPIVHEKKHAEPDERTINLSALAAVGILALAFFKGMFWGYVLKKR